MKRLASLFAAAMAAAALAATADVDSASSRSTWLSCSKGGVGTNVAWARCSGYGTWRLVAICHWRPKQSTGYMTQYGGSVYRTVSCGWRSRVTATYIEYA